MPYYKFENGSIPPRRKLDRVKKLIGEVVSADGMAKDKEKI